MNDKLMIFNSKNQIFIGIAFNYDWGNVCSNSIKYGDPSTFGSSPFLKFVLPCDNYFPNLSFTRFLLLMNDDTILNIGQECSEINIGCFNTYLTIYSVISNPFKYGITKKKIMLFPTNFLLEDAILSTDQRNIYILVNYGNSPNQIFSITIIEISNLPIPSTINSKFVSDLIFPLYCTKINEYILNIFALHCISLEYAVTMPDTCCQNNKEVVYFIERVNDQFIFKMYFDLYELKFFHLSLLMGSNGLNIAIGTSKFFDILYLDSTSNYARTNIEKTQFPVIINGISFINGIFIYGGCEMQKPNFNYSAKMLSFDSSYNYKAEYLFPNSVNWNCITSQMTINSKNILISFSEKVDAQYYLFSLIMMSPSFAFLSTSGNFTTYSEEIPLALNSQNQIIAVRTSMNSSSLKRYIILKTYDIELKFINDIYYVNQIDISATTLLFNLNGEITFGGYSLNLKMQGFWVGYYNSKSELVTNHILGKKHSKVTGSITLSKRIQTFFGFQNKRSTEVQPNYSYMVYSIILYITDYGKFIQQDLILDPYFVVWSSGKNFEGQINVYGIQYDSLIHRKEVNSNIICPKPNHFIDQIEYECFENCVLNVNYNTTKECNPLTKGCDSNGRKQDEYFCIKDKLLLKQEMESEFSIKIWANLVENDDILVQLNSSVVSYFNKVSVKTTTPRRKNFICLNFQSIDYSSYKFLFLVNPPAKCQINCAKSIKVAVSYMGLQSVNGNKVNPTVLKVGNVSQHSCNNKISQMSAMMIASTNSSVLISSSVLMGGNFLSFNPLGIITLMNSMNELMTFQLLNCQTIYPENVNEFLNTNSFFSLNFLYNPITLFIDPAYFNNSDWLDNNIASHSSLPSATFIYNFIQICVSFLVILILIIIIYSFPFVGYLGRKTKSRFYLNFIISVYISIFYQFTVTAFGGAFYDTSIFDFFSLISSLLSYIVLAMQSIITIYFFSLLYYEKKQLANPDFEYTYSILYEDLDDDDDDDTFSLKSSIIFNFKLQLLVLLGFAFQDYPVIQLFSFVFVYTISVILKLAFRPNQSFSGNLQSLIRELLFWMLSGLFCFYYFFVIRDNYFLFSLPDAILFLMAFIIINEFIFSLYNIISSLKGSCCEASVKSKIRIPRTFELCYIECLNSMKNELDTLQPNENKIKMKYLNPEKLRLSMQIHPKINEFHDPLSKGNLVKNFQNFQAENLTKKTRNMLREDPNPFKPLKLLKPKSKNQKASNSKNFQNSHISRRKLFSKRDFSKNTFLFGKNNFINESKTNKESKTKGSKKGKIYNPYEGYHLSLYEDFNPENQIIEEDFLKEDEENKQEDVDQIKYENKKENQNTNLNESQNKITPILKSQNINDIQEDLKEDYKHNIPPKAQNSSDKNEIINVHIGQSGSNIGLEFWLKLSSEEGLSNEGYSTLFHKNEGSNINTFFYRMFNDKYSPRALFIDNNDKIPEIMLAKKIDTLFDNSNYSILKNKMFHEIYFSNSENKETFLNSLIEGALKTQLERCDSLQGFLLTYSAGGTAGSHIGLMFHKLISDLLSKPITIDISLFNSSYYNLSSTEIMNEINTLNWSSGLSTLVIPILTNSITNRIGKVAYYEGKKDFFEENDVIADTLSIMTYPFRKCFQDSFSLRNFVDKLSFDLVHKFICCNLYPIHKTGPLITEEYMIIDYCINNVNFSGSSFSNFPNRRNLVISEGLLSNHGIDLINHYIKQKNSKIIPIQNQPKSVFDLANYHFGNFEKKNLSRLLFLSNSSSISYLFKLIEINLKKLSISSDSPVKLLKEGKSWDKTIQSSSNMISNLIRLYENLYPV